MFLSETGRIHYNEYAGKDQYVRFAGVSGVCLEQEKEGGVQRKLIVYFEENPVIIDILISRDDKKDRIVFALSVLFIIPVNVARILSGRQ